MVFTKHAGNPLLNLGAGGTWDDVHLYSISVLYRNHNWYMYYSGHDGANIRIGLATSSDGITWTKHAGNPLLNIGAGGTWDAVSLYGMSVLYRNNKWYMYYTGYDGVNTRIGLATSPDGITWTKHPNNPILNLGAGGTWDDVSLYTTSVLYRNNKWYMYYSGHDGVNHRIGLATSPDGITWTKHPNNPLLNLGAGGTWDDVHLYGMSVLYRNNKWYMYYSGHDGVNPRIGLATSPDGITWTKHPNNPILNLGAGGTWDAGHVFKPKVLYRNNKWYMYYTGHDGANLRTGLATSPTGV
jgi:predicted GH43/DUF377 family glycosyl hydrolase